MSGYDPAPTDDDHCPHSSDRFSPMDGVSDADRAVSAVIGAILIFGLVVGLLALLQVTAIPALNEQIEFQHNDRAQTDIVGVSEVIDRVAATGNRETTQIEAGVSYPPRLFFVNPPPATGSLETTDPNPVEIAGAHASGDVGDYWDGGPKTFETRALEYEPGYNEYSNAPVTVSEPWVVYNRFGETTLSKTDQDLVDGRKIDLIALDGDRSESRAGSVPLRVTATSGPTQTITVRDDGEPVTLTIPTALTEDEWGDLLEDELDADATENDQYVTDFDCRVAPPDPCEELTITLQQGETYELRLGAVAVGSGVAAEDVAYLTAVSGGGTSVLEGGQQRLVVEARDRFDNPVSGVDVSERLSGVGSVRAVDPVTDSDGRAVFVYEAPDTVDSRQDVAVTTSVGDEPWQEATFDIRIPHRGGTGTTPVGGPTVTITDVNANFAGNTDRYTVHAEASDATGDLERIEYELRNPNPDPDPDSGADPIIDTATVGVSGEHDSVSAQLRAQGADRQEAYRLVVTAFDAAGNSGSTDLIVSGGGS